MQGEEEESHLKRFYGDDFDKLMFEQNNNDITFYIKEEGILKGSYIKYHYLCPKCHFFPYIQIVNQNEIYYTCGCTNGERKLIAIKEFINEKNGYITKSDYEVQKGLSKNKDLKCNEHNHKFKYYCKKCHINICKYCCKFHLKYKHDLINFDVVDIDISDKVKEVIEFFNIKLSENAPVIEIQRNLDNSANFSELLQNSSIDQEDSK